MAELIPEVVLPSENDSTTVKVTSVRGDEILEIQVDLIQDTVDDYVNWVYFGVGGPA